MTADEAPARRAEMKTDGRSASSGQAKVAQQTPTFIGIQNARLNLIYNTQEQQHWEEAVQESQSSMEACISSA
jgi:hypothetical protein